MFHIVLWIYTLLLVSNSLYADQGNGDAVRGKLKAIEERCVECHGEDGNSVDVKTPNHAGQIAGYLIKQLLNFQSGERKHETMTIMAADLTANDIDDIAAYFSGQKVMQGEGSIDNPLAGNLMLNGDQLRDLPACGSCHGEKGKGAVKNNVVYPVIGGQRKVYLFQQLQSWRMGERKNSPEGVMNKIAKSLQDEEIEALADYLSRL
ncbi:c-type cytochrome [Methylomonas sp. AM2-LC]|uniref:c-type cytochrome n=1 Tax=Methylomonas sp. AM2-LC TaxID=3153301 RepID=UPI003263D7B1